MDQIIELLEKLNINADKNDTLVELKLIMSSLSANDIGRILKVSSAGSLIQCLKSNKKDTELACEILEKILPFYSCEFLITNFENELKEGLLSSDPLVQQLVLRQILKCQDAEPDFLKLLTNTSVLSRIVALLAENDLLVVENARKILIKLSSFNKGLELIFSTPIISCFLEVMNRNDVIKYRALDVIVAMCKQSSVSAERCISANLLAELLNDVDSHDILIQLNAFELLADLASAYHGLVYLENIGCVRKLETALDISESDVTAKLLLPGLFKFFGQIGHLYPDKVCRMYKKFVNRIYDTILSESSSSSFIEIAIETVAFIGLTEDGKMALHNLGNETTELMKRFGKLVQEAPFNLKITTLNALKRLFSLQERERSEKAEGVTHKWFDSLTENPMKLLSEMCKQPFLEIRCAVFGIFKEIAALRWGQQYMSQHPGFIEYLLDRSTEGDKDGKMAKFEVVNTLANSSTTAEVFGNVILLRLKAYVLEGPYFIRVESAVTIKFDGDS